MIEIKQGEAATYDFSLEITGSAAGSPEIRFTIAHPNGYLLSYNTIALEHGGWRVSLPNLDPVLPPGQHPCALEVVLGDRYFKPLFETLHIVERANASVSGFNRVPSSDAPTVSVVSKPYVQTVQVNPQPAPAPVETSTTYEQKEEVKPPLKEEVKAPKEEKKPAPKTYSAADEGLFATLLKKK